MDANVLVVEKKTGKLIAKVPVVLALIGGNPSEGDFAKEAWRCVVEDGLAPEGKFNEYIFEVGV